MDVFGTTRSRVARNHALITPDTHVRSPLVGWQNAQAVVHISPPLGAKFLQYTAYLEASGCSDEMMGHDIERFAYVLEGHVDVQSVHSSRRSQPLGPGGFVYLPPRSQMVIRSEGPAKLEVFEKRYVPLEGRLDDLPEMVLGDAAAIAAEPFMGDEAARLKTLLPRDPLFDMAVNLFTFDPGATLPLVEIHVMEHGLLLLEGAGVYRLGEDYYPITAGDVIWMAAYCPQWWVAMGKTPSTYLYYKDVHRERLGGLP